MGTTSLRFCEINNLAVMNTYYKHRESHKWSWHRCNYPLQSYTQRSMIELFLTNNKALFHDVKAIPSVSMDADHRHVMAVVRIMKPEYTGRVSSKRYKLAKLTGPEQVERWKGAIEVKLVKDDGGGGRERRSTMETIQRENYRSS